MSAVAHSPSEARRFGPVDIKFEDMHLQVGVPMQMLIVSANRQYTTTLVGYLRDEYVIVRIPMVNGLSISLGQGEAINVRVFTGVSVFTFKTHVERLLLGGLYLILLSFPKEIQATKFRGAVRVAAQLTAQVANNTAPAGGDATSATICDLSMHGALLTSPAMIWAIGDEVTVSFSLGSEANAVEAHLELKARIKNVQVQGNTDRHRHGLEFDPLQGSNKAALQEFLYQRMLETRPAAP